MRRNKSSAIVVEILATMAVTLLLSASAAAANTYKILHAFTWAHGPAGALARDAAGNLYGTTLQGAGTGCGGNGCGTVWKLAPNANGTWTNTTLHVFGGGDGAWPNGGLVLDAAGNIYGTAPVGGSSTATLCVTVYTAGCGVVFKLKPNSNGSWSYSVIHSFNWGIDGATPGPVIFDASGNLYGETAFGSTFGNGLIFKLTPHPGGPWTESIVYTFTEGADGGRPYGGLVFDASGNLYGYSTTSQASVSSPECCGVVWKLAPNANRPWTETTLYTFTGGTDGGTLAGSPTLDANGNLYGTTSDGGAASACPSILTPGCGVVFKLTLNSNGTWTQSVIHTFPTIGGDGEEPAAGVTLDTAGNLYGTAKYGGIAQFISGYGVVFKLTQASGGWSEDGVPLVVGS
ncbi:MAG: choice-of-anchor tandem repeat GloVer-containing protein [Terriglobales bacterium]